MGELIQQIDKIHLFLIITIPGFISMKIWTLVNPSERIKIADYFVEVVCYSFFNFVLLFWLIRIANTISNPFSTITYIFILLVAPIFWPIALRKLLSSKFLKGKIIHPTPKAWDYYFQKGEQCFILIHLKNGNLIGGLYYQDSFTSSYPEDEDLYLKEVWKIDNDGKFINKIEGTNGLLIKSDAFEYIELFKSEGE